jgi:hypothetical protein
MFIPDPGSSSKNSSILTPKKAKKWFQSSKKYDPGCSSRIPDPDADFLPSRIPELGYRGQKGTQSRIPDPDPQHCYLLDPAFENGLDSGPDPNTIYKKVSSYFSLSEHAFFGPLQRLLFWEKCGQRESKNIKSFLPSQPQSTYI